MPTDWTVKQVKQCYLSWGTLLSEQSLYYKKYCFNFYEFFGGWIVAKLSVKCFCWFPAAMLVPIWTPKQQEPMGAIHSTKIPTGPTGKSGPPQNVDPFSRNFSGWTEPIHWVLDRNFRKFWLNGSRPMNSWKQSVFLRTVNDRLSAASRISAAPLLR